MTPPVKHAAYENASKPLDLSTKTPSNDITLAKDADYEKITEPLDLSTKYLRKEIIFAKGADHENICQPLDPSTKSLSKDITYAVPGGSTASDMTQEQSSLRTEASTESTPGNSSKNIFLGLNNKDKISCPFCGKSLQCTSAMIKHKLTHTHEKSFQCDEYGYRVAKWKILSPRKLTGRAEYPCEVCNKVYKTSNSLKVHVAKHAGIKAFKCDECSKAFTNSSAVGDYECIHRLEKPYVCQICNVAFKTSSILSVHKRIHTGKKQYACDQCNKKFVHQHVLTRHKEKTHTL